MRAVRINSAICAGDFPMLDSCLRTDASSITALVVRDFRYDEGIESSHVMKNRSGGPINLMTAHMSCGMASPL